MRIKINYQKIDNGASIGIVGLGMMGSSIATALLIKGKKIVALSSTDTKIDLEAPERIKKSLLECINKGLTNKAQLELLENIHFTSDFADLRSCWLVMDCVIEDLNIKNFFERKTGELSSGQKNRVSLAKSLINKPEILLLDEPTASLDPDIGDFIRSYIQAVSYTHLTLPTIYSV